MHAEETLLYLKKCLIENEVGNIKYINDGTEWYYLRMIITDIILSDNSQFLRGLIQHILNHTSV
jgi:hypothetical protein